MGALIDAVLGLVGPEGAAAIVAVAAMLSAMMPVLERLADKTATTWDNRALWVIRELLSYVPRVRLGGK